MKRFCLNFSEPSTLLDVCYIIFGLNLRLKNSKDIGSSNYVFEFESEKTGRFLYDTFVKLSKEDEISVTVKEKYNIECCNIYSFEYDELINPIDYKEILENEDESDVFYLC